MDRDTPVSLRRPCSSSCHRMASANAIPLDTTTKPAILNLETQATNRPSDNTLAQSILNQLLVVAPVDRSSGFASWSSVIRILGMQFSADAKALYLPAPSNRVLFVWLEITSNLGGHGSRTTSYTTSLKATPTGSLWSWATNCRTSFSATRHANPLVRSQAFFVWHFLVIKNLQLTKMVSS